MYIGPQDLRRLFSNVSRFFSSSSAFELVFHFTAINTKYNVSLPFPHHFLYLIFFFFKRILKIAVINPNYKNCIDGYRKTTSPDRLITPCITLKGNLQLIKLSFSLSLSSSFLVRSNCIDIGKQRRKRRVIIALWRDAKRNKCR